MIKPTSTWKSGVTDHETEHTNLVKEHNIKSVIEFGCGAGTEMFLRICESVTSVELHTSDKELAQKLPISDDKWMNYYKGYYKDYTNWTPVLIGVTPSIIEAEWDVTGKGTRGVKRGDDPSSFDFLKDLSKLLDPLDCANYDMAFVDAGIHLRGDIVNYLFNKVDVITIHDTNGAINQAIYGVNRIKKPDSYNLRRGVTSHCGLYIYTKKTR